MIQNSVDVTYISNTRHYKNGQIIGKRNSSLFTGITIHALKTKKQQSKKQNVNGSNGVRVTKKIIH